MGDDTGEPPMLYELKKVRQKSGLTQQEASERLGVSINTYRNWEQLKSMPRTMVETRRVADFLGVTMEQLFGEDMLERGSLTFAETQRSEPDMQLEYLVHDYTSMNDEGRRVLCRVASSMAKDPRNRVCEP